MKNTTLCYLEQDGSYLMLHRVKKENDMNRDKWLGIGGKFEDRESPDDCALRECLEETGLTMAEYRYRAVVTFVSDIYPTEYMHLFHCTGFTGTLRDCDEGTLEWVPKEKVPQLPIWEGDKIFLKLLDSDRPFFSLKLEYHGDKLVAAVLDGKPISTDSSECPA